MNITYWNRTHREHTATAHGTAWRIRKADGGNGWTVYSLGQGCVPQYGSDAGWVKRYTAPTLKAAKAWVA